jgi:N-acylneuraminate cytidylyltransferase
VVALIPARAGSKGLPRKNIVPLGGYPLIAYSITAARLSRLIQRIVVSTDSAEIGKISRKYGAQVPFLRPAALAGDRSPDRDFVLHALEWFDRHEGAMPEYLVHLRPTTPLRDPALVDAAITSFLSNPDATSLRSAHEAPESPLKWFVRDERGYFSAFGARESGSAHSNLPRQAFPPVYVPDGYVDVLRTAFVLKASDDIHGERIMAYVSPMCREVDTAEDLEFLEFQLVRKRNPVWSFLKTHHPAET